jgi:hypothetical protein
MAPADQPKARVLTDDEIVRCYKSLMEEIKWRLPCVGEFLTLSAQAHRSGDKPMTKVYFESAALQTRRICELTAIAALCAHQTISPARTKRLQGKAFADDIFTHLSKLNDWPLQMRSVETRPSEHVALFESHQGLFTKAHLREIYTSCGSMLHANSLLDIIDGKRHHYNLDQVHAWMQTIIDLLGPRHTIFVDNPEGKDGPEKRPPRMLVCEMGELRGGTVRVFLTPAFPPA